MRILYVGELWPGGTAGHRADALVDLGHTVDRIDSTSPLGGLLGIATRGLRKVGHWIDVTGVNKTLLEMLRSETYNVIWIDKGLTISPRTLDTARRLQPSAKLVAYSPDDMAAQHNQSRRYMAGLAKYDVHVTTKSYNVRELELLGARRMVFVDNGYHPSVHRPVALSQQDSELYGADVAFVGQYERERAEQIEYLAAHGITVTVWGLDWNRLKTPPAGVRIMGRPVWGHEYAKVLNATKINLCFLRKINRDLQTTRSVEIPACGAFMLGERTCEHLRLFVEGEEAEFFASNNELLRKCEYYSTNAAKRTTIAKNGLRRCVDGGYSNHNRLAKVLSLLH